ncbi:MAG: AAA family ATPase [Planctomycetota bacterium]|jgi:predicted ATP-binding protein involved in virulence
MRIKRVFVEKLFHLFDHDIPMNMDDRITIIHAPNGFGKTAMLRMIDGLFNSRYAELRSLPFGAFGVELNDGRTIRVERRNGPRARRKRRLRKPDGGSLVFCCSSGEEYARASIPDAEELPFPAGAIEEIVPDLFQVSSTTWQTSQGETLNQSGVLERYSDILRRYFPRRWKQPEEPEWLREIKTSVDVRFIRADRLFARAEVRRVRGHERRSVPTPTVMSYSEELASAIGSTLTKYAELSQSLDRTFPVRLVSQSASADLTNQEIAQRLSEFEAKRKRLIESGLLDQEIDPDFQIPETIDETKTSVLSVYVRDVQEKLAVFDALATKLDLFKSIINRRFKHKHVAISRDDGISFTTDTGQPLDATSLSSGEQHEVVMLYELLFKLRPDSLILVDEPEISLHVAWQEQFLRDLQEMTELSGFDVLIATHSPQIISNRWDLAVELQDTVELQEAVQ